MSHRHDETILWNYRCCLDRQKYESTSDTNHRKADVGGENNFPVKWKPRNSDFVPCWRSFSIPPDLALILTFEPDLRWSRTPPSARSWLLSSSHVNTDTVGRHVAVAHCAIGCRQRSPGKRARALGLCQRQWRFILYHLPHGHIGQIVDLLVPQLPHLQKAGNSIWCRAPHVLSKIRHVRQPAWCGAVAS